MVAVVAEPGGRNVILVVVVADVVVLVVDDVVVVAVSLVGTAIVVDEMARVPGPEQAASASSADATPRTARGHCRRRPRW